MTPGPRRRAKRRPWNLEAEPHADAQDPRRQHVRRRSERARVRLAVPSEDGSAVERVEQVGGEAEGGVSAELDVVGETEIRVPEVVVALVVDLAHGQCP